MVDIYGFASRAAFQVLRYPNRIVAHTYLDLSVVGKENVPDHGPVVIAANHFSHLDPPLISTILDRYTRFLAVDDLYGKSRIFDATLNLFNAIPLDRDGYPVAALRTAVNHLVGGDMIGLFPEGRRVESWGGDEPKRGAAWLAWMSGAPVIPVAILGTNHSLAAAESGFHRTAVRVWIDKPLWWFDYVDRIDPLGDMMADWYEAVDAHLAPWQEDA